MNMQLDLFSNDVFANPWVLAGAVDCYCEDQLRKELRDAIIDSRTVEAWGAHEAARHLDDLILATRYSADSQVIALRDSAKTTIQKLYQMIEAYEAEIEVERAKAWKMIGPASVVFSELVNPFPNTRVVLSRAY